MAQLPIALPLDAIRAFCKKWRVTEFTLFGSALRSDFGPDSDVDVLVEFDEGAPWSLWDLATMRQELVDLFGRPVDFIEGSALKNPFRRQAILASKQVVYAA